MHDGLKCQKGFPQKQHCLTIGFTSETLKILASLLENLYCQMNPCGRSLSSRGEQVKGLTHNRLQWYIKSSLKTFQLPDWGTGTTRSSGRTHSLINLDDLCLDEHLPGAAVALEHQHASVAVLTRATHSRCINQSGLIRQSFSCPTPPSSHSCYVRVMTHAEV